MPNLPITQLPSASLITGTESLPVVQGGVTTQATTQDLLNNVQYIQFDTTPSVTGQVGRMWWNTDKGTANIRLKNNNVTLQVGQELVTQVYNGTGANWLEANYPVVYISGSNNGDPKGYLAQANALSTTAATLGIVTETINNGNTGYVTTYGLVNNINTSGFAAGSILYLSPTTPGGLTTTRPGAPNFDVEIGQVLVSDINTGSIYVDIKPGYSYPQYLTAYNTSSLSGSADTELLATFNTVSLNNGISIVSGSQITVSQPGAYSISVHAQIDKVGAAPSDSIISFWLKQNGSAVAYSTNNIVISGNQNTADTVFNSNYLVNLTAGQYVEIAWSTPDVDIVLAAQGPQTSPTRPGTPSIEVFITKIA